MTKCSWDDLKDAEIDFLTYSTPCQSISQAGKREGIKKDSGTRSAVLWYTEEAVRMMRPKILLQENVRALINQVNMPDFREWCQLLEKHGYVNFLAPSFPISWAKEKREKKTVHPQCQALWCGAEPRTCLYGEHTQGHSWQYAV